MKLSYKHYENASRPIIDPKARRTVPTAEETAQEIRDMQESMRLAGGGGGVAAGGGGGGGVAAGGGGGGYVGNEEMLEDFVRQIFMKDGTPVTPASIAHAVMRYRQEFSAEELGFQMEALGYFDWIASGRPGLGGGGGGGSGGRRRSRRHRRRRGRKTRVRRRKTRRHRRR